MRRRTVTVVAISVLAAAGVALALLARDDGRTPPPRRDDGPIRLADRGDHLVVTNEDGAWTVYKRCVRTRTGGGTVTVGPGYVARLVSRDGIVLVDDVRSEGTLNDPEYGGLGAFAWHHARGRPGRLRLGKRNAWEVSGRTCAVHAGGFGVQTAHVVEPPHKGVDGAGEPFVGFALDVSLTDAFTAPRAVVRARYRYRVYRSVVKSWLVVRQQCPHGRCGRTRSLAFVKEPKLVAHVAGNRAGYTRLATFDDAGRLVCVYAGGGPPTGPILDTGQCGAPGRARLRFDFGTTASGEDGRCDERACLNVVMRSYAAGGFDVPPANATYPWYDATGRRGLDGWAIASSGRPRAYHVDTASIDGVVTSCKGGDPGAAALRRWEVTGRLDARGRYLSLGGLFPGWEGGRGGYDCEPLARLFGPAGETWAVFASYSLGAGWEDLK